MLVTRRDWESRSSCFLCQKNVFSMYNTIHMHYDDSIHHSWLWWFPSSVVRGILFKAINSCSDFCSTSMNSAGRPYFHVPWPAVVLCWLSRRATATLFVNVFTLITIVRIAKMQWFINLGNCAMMYSPYGVRSTKSPYLWKTPCARWLPSTCTLPEYSSSVIDNNTSTHRSFRTQNNT